MKFPLLPLMFPATFLLHFLKMFRNSIDSFPTTVPILFLKRKTGRSCHDLIKESDQIGLEYYGNSIIKNFKAESNKHFVSCLLFCLFLDPFSLVLKSN